jgi:hypothetical protein
LNTKIFAAEALSRGDETPKISFKYHSPHLKNGYPGNLDCEVMALQDKWIGIMVLPDKPR